MSTPNPSTGGQRGAQPVGGPNDGGTKKKPWWLLALLAIIAIIVLILLLSRCGSGDNTATGAAASATSAASSATSSAGSATPSSTTPSGVATTTAPASPTGTGAGTGPLTVNGAGLLPLATAAPDGTLTAFVGQTATSTGVTVQSVPADEGFWVGTSATDRVWVQIIGGGESPYKVTAGDKVDFTGTVVANATDFPATVGLTAADGAAQLTTQAAHIEVPQGGVTLTK